MTTPNKWMELKLRYTYELLSERMTTMEITHNIQIEKIQKQLNAYEQSMREMETRMTALISKCESIGYAELELCKGTMCIDENYNYNNNIVTHFPLHSKQIHLTGLGGIKNEFTLLKLLGFYNLNHLCLSSVVAIEPYRLERYYIEHKIAPIPDDTIFSNTVKILELRDCTTAFEDLKIISRFPSLTKLIVRRCVLSEHIHLILPALKHTITEIDFINVRSTRNINYTELLKYCDANNITLKVE